MSKIIILTGSPRKDGNTDRLAAAFAKGATQHNDVEIVAVRDYDIHPCRGCNACFSRQNNECVQNDGMADIYNKLSETDILVIASPVYFYGISSQLKAVIDRLHTPLRTSFHIQKLGLILVGAAKLPELFDAILTQYQLVLNYFHLGDVGRVLVRGANNKGDVSEEDLQNAYNVGRRINQ
ncbi:MAG: flavodoxin family protein [Spirochaetales bacterium]|nr:flavodoxin family protein [Spirochaetales bacterium]